MRSVLRFSTLALGLLASACTVGQGTRDGGPTLKAAVKKTLAAEGFHIEGAISFGGERIESEGDYVAPDRMSMSSSDGPTGSTTIVVGRNHYASEPEDSSTFRLWEMPCDVGVDTFIPAFAVVLHAEDVRLTGGAFAFRADGNEGTPIEGEADVTDGYLTGLVLRYTLPRIHERVEERWTFSDFGTMVHIEPPAEEQVLDEPGFEGNPPIVPITGQPPACP